jgi:hypothetical protein
MKTPKPLVCFYGVPWLWHFKPPIGTGQCCAACDGQLSLPLEQMHVSRRGTMDMCATPPVPHRNDGLFEC